MQKKDVFRVVPDYWKLNFGLGEMERQVTAEFNNGLRIFLRIVDPMQANGCSDGGEN